jgi:hypothetical protein
VFGIIEQLTGVSTWRRSGPDRRPMKGPGRADGP